MSELDMELMKLETIAFEKFRVFNNLLLQEIGKLQHTEGFDQDRFTKELRNCSPEGIELNIAVEKIEKYKLDNGIT